MLRAARVRTTLASSVVLVLAASGCEIIATFDRDKIPDDGGLDASYDVQYSSPDGAEPDAAVLSDGAADGTSPLPEAGADAAPLDAGTADAAVEAGTLPDAAADGTSPVTEAGADATSVDSGAPDAAAADASAVVEAGDDAGN